ncbi:MAG: aminotransferase class III-fold pyridoxal phosphate-dependent enzyme, partial [Flavobacteriales bacterium]
KALGGGMPLSALLASEERLKTFRLSPPLGHITSTGGHPLSCAAGKATIDTLKEEKLLEQVEEKGARMEELLQHPAVHAIRRSGLMIGIDMDSRARANELVQKARKKGVLLFSFLSHPIGVRIAPPLNISMDDLEEAGKRIREALDELRSDRS